MTAIFETLRPQLFRLAYGMLGSVSLAEEVVQDAWLRFERSPAPDNPTGWLRTVTSRLALDELKSARHRREVYPGPWLPEPWLEVPDRVEQAELLSMAMLVVLEALTPAERAAFLLREMFELDYAEIATVLERSAPACRQLVKRAKDHVAARSIRHSPDPESHAALLGAVAQAAMSGDLEGLKALLAADAIYASDGGGKVTAALRILEGPDRVAKFLIGVLRKGDGQLGFVPSTVNGRPGVLLMAGGSVIGATAFSVHAGKVTAIHQVVNPDKLAHLQT